jgi:redox-sensing transcriptional repressor
MRRTDVPDVVIRRLPLYLRCLTYMAERGQSVVSSQELGAWVGVSSAQIRKDLSYFGEFGRQGLGYEVTYLRDQLRTILQADKRWSIVLVGAGALGHALVNYRAFESWNYDLSAVLDNDPEKVGQPIGDLRVRPMEDLVASVHETGAKIAILAVPAEAAQSVAEQLVAAGIRAILNYAPMNLVLPAEIHVSYIDPIASLQSTAFYL